MNKNSIYLLFGLVLTIIGCGKMDTNGTLDGNWQMTEWIDNSTKEVVKDKNAQLFYTIKLELLQMQDKSRESVETMPYLAYFDHRGDSLILGKVFKKMNNTDTLVTFSDVQKLGVAPDGKFFIELLTDEHMVLRNNINTLKFRKY